MADQPAARTGMTNDEYAELAALRVLLCAVLRVQRSGMPPGEHWLQAVIAGAHHQLDQTETSSVSWRQIGADKTRIALERVLQGFGHKPRR